MKMLILEFLTSYQSIATSLACVLFYTFRSFLIWLHLLIVTWFSFFSCNLKPLCPNLGFSCHRINFSFFFFFLGQCRNLDQLERKILPLVMQLCPTKFHIPPSMHGAMMQKDQLGDDCCLKSSSFWFQIIL